MRVRRQSLLQTPTSNSQFAFCNLQFAILSCESSSSWINLKELLAVFHRLLVFDQNLGDDAVAVGRDFIKDFHRLDEADDRGGGDARANSDKGLGIGTGGAIESARRRTLDG